MTNPLNLPAAVAAYFEADRLDSKAVARCFTENAIVKDEGRTYTGAASIERWKSEVATKYTYTSKPFAMEQKEGTVVVKSHLSGDFPGSPVDLRFSFQLDNGKIAFLEIMP